VERRHLEYLVAIERHGGFARAASALLVTQSALSQAISQLERELGAELFHRNVRPVRLTAAGEAILDPARQTLRGFTTIREAASSVAGLSSGQLEVATLPALAQWPATPLVATFRRRYSGVRVHILGPPRSRIAELAEMVRRGDCEIGLTEEHAHTQNLVEISLGSHDYVAVLPPDTVAPDRSLSFEEVLSLGIIIGPWWETSRPYIAIQERHPQLVEESVVIRIDHREAYLPLILAGAGAAFLPRFVGDMAAAAGAVIAELSEPITRALVLVHRDESLTPAARAFCDVAAADTSSKPHVPSGQKACPV